MSESEHFTVLIIGSGPAGLTAALYASRANLKPLVLEGPQAGGQLTITTDVENYPGFPEGIEGPEMMNRFRDQARRFGTDVREQTVTGVEMGEHPFRVTAQDPISDGRVDYTCDALIISSGASAKLLGLPEEERLMKQGGGVSACATCDGALPPYRNQHLVVIGGGDTAMEESLFLTRYGSKVSVVHRRDELRASQIMRERAEAHEKIEFVWNTVVTGFVLEPTASFITGVRTLNRVTEETGQIDCAGLFIAIGHQPNTELFKGQLEMDDQGYLITKPDRTATDIEGVYVCGDAQDHFYRQAVTAAGTGCMAAIEAERWLAEKGIG